jgi:ligand-binding sensor domain-containing protein/signal transduction histidine kinase
MKLSLTYLLFLILWIEAVYPHHPNADRRQKSITQYTLDIWTTKEGLPQNSVDCIAQTNDGYIWMGTQEGLVRFDGVRFTVFDKSNTTEIDNNYITTLFVDRGNRLWIGTYDGGVIVYADRKFHAVDTIPLFKNAHIRAIHEDRSGRLWVAVRSRGVVCIDNGVHHIYDTTRGLTSNEPWTFCEDDLGRIWIGTEGGISIVENDRIHSLTTKNGLVSDNVNALCRGKDGSMWIGTNAGMMNVPLDLSDRSGRKTYSVDDGLPDRIVYSIFSDRSDLVWIGTRKGAALLNNNIISTFTTGDGLSYEHVAAVFVDREKNIWLGTDGGGVNVLREGNFSTLTKRQGLPSDVIWTVYEDPEGRMWIGTDKGLALLNHDRATVSRTFTMKDGLYDNEVYSIGADTGGTAWIGTVNGLNIIRNGKVQSVVPTEKTGNVIVGCVFIDSRNRVWVATTGNGVLLFVNSSLRAAYTTSQGIAGNYINLITEDRKGNIWIGTDGEGISVISDSGIVSYSEQHGLPNNFIHSIYIDSADVVWIGTFGGGLARWKNGRFTSLSTQQGLYNDALLNVLEDNLGNMWFTSNKGVFYIRKSEVDACMDGLVPSVTSKSLGKADGLKSTEFNGGVQPAGWKSHNGTLWFPTAHGVATIDPVSIRVNQQPPLVVFEELVADNRIVQTHNGGTIPPGTERYEFRFTGLSFSNPSKITFKVKLEGYDDKWDDIGTRRSAYYTHLPPGTYTFNVHAANSDGIWSEQSASFTFTQEAYFYETTLFFVTVSVIIALLAYGGYRYRIRSIHQRSLILERLVNERTKDLHDAQAETVRLLEESRQQKIIAEKANEMKSQLLDMVAHDLKTPLVSVSIFAKELQNAAPLNDRAKEDLSLIQKSVERMISLINNLVNISTIESGRLQMRKEDVNLVELAGMTVDGLRMQAQRKQQMLFFLPAATTECMVIADSHRMQEAIENIINNAIKYSPHGSEIVVSVEKVDDVVRFWVQDNGPGISDDDKHRLFKKFQTLSAKPTANEHSTGLGLAIVKEIVQAHDGRVYVESFPGKGSKFVIELKSA